jgi:hypothetical protein
MTSAEKKELEYLLSDAIQEWFTQEDEELQDQQKEDLKKIDELFAKIIIKD